MEKHPNIPDGASWNERLQRWTLGELDPHLNRLVGDYYEWDANGVICLKQVFNRDTGAFIEEREYIRGQLYTLEENTPEGLNKTQYFLETDPPAIEKRKLYSNEARDQITTYFTRQGLENCTIHAVLKDGLLTREYFNGVLIFECIPNEDKTKAPVSVRYLYKSGATMIDYASNGDGTGWWRLYDEAGQEVGKLPELNEPDKIKTKYWTLFSPDPDDYNEEALQPDWVTIPREFKREMMRSNTPRN